MESLSRPLLRRKLSNANSFSGKNAYDSVFSGHRPKFEGAPSVNVEEYREIFSSAQADSSIPVLDLSTFEESSDGSNLELGSTKPDYGKIFGGFRDQDIAVSYEELVARDKARAPSTISQSSQDLGDPSHQSFDALKQFNMSYNKISQRSKDGLDGTTHVAQLHVVPGFTCFVDESASQSKKEIKKQKSSVIPEKQTSQNATESRSNLRQDESLSDDRNLKTFQADPKSHPSKVSSSPATSATNDEAALQPKKETEKQKPSKPTSRSAVDESLSDDRISKKFQADIKLHPSKVSSSPAVSATNVENHKDYQKRSSATNMQTCKNDASGGFFPTFFDEELEVNSAAAASAAALRKAIEKAQESIRIAKESVGRKKEGLRSFSSKSFKDSLKVKARVANVSTGEEQKEKDNKMKETRERKGDESQVFSNIGRNSVVFPDLSDGEKLFGAKKVIDEIHGKISESAKSSEIPITPSHELRDNKLAYDSKEVVGEIEAASLDSTEKSVENNTYEAPQKDDQRPNVFLELESCEKKLGDTEDTINDVKPIESKEDKDEVRASNPRKLAEGSNNLTVYQKVEDERNISQRSDQTDYVKRFSESLELLENKEQEVLEQEHNETVVSEKVVEDERELKEDSDTESHKEEDMGDKFYDVCELEMTENAQTYAYGSETNEVPPKEDCEMKDQENHKSEEIWEKLDKFQEPEAYESSSSDYDDAEESESVLGCHGASYIVIDTNEACKVDESDNNVESSQEVDEVSNSSSSPQVTEAFSEFQVEAIEVVFENISADQSASEDNEDESETKSDDLSNCGSADVDFRQNAAEQNDVRSESSSDTIHGMEIEVKEYKESEEIVDQDENNLQKSHEARPEIEIKMATGTSQEPKVSNGVEATIDMNKEKKEETRESGKEQNKRIKEVNPEEREWERNRLAVERAIREARERAFAEARERAERAAVERANAEVRQRVMADAQEKVAKASIGTKLSDKSYAQFKLRAERAAVERATAEARQRALEKAMSQKKLSEPKVQVHETRQPSSSDLHVSNGESAQRSKAKLEKHNRIMERAAKALAEKEKRDLLAQKEQAERSRIAENLDAEIKRWSNGKEGNLRALLSTLQYILGAESGWQPVSLTEIITTSAVKKAYRKATLCVHPDKLQQRGASIQQKYICEKVFDLLKAAWSRCNSEER